MAEKYEVIKKDGGKETVECRGMVHDANKVTFLKDGGDLSFPVADVEDVKFLGGS